MIKSCKIKMSLIYTVVLAYYFYPYPTYTLKADFILNYENYTGKNRERIDIYLYDAIKRS